MTLAEEHELWQRIRADKKEFGVLFDHYFKPIFGYLYRRTGEYELAKDMAAETFLKAFFKIDSFEWRHISFSSWLYRIATNEANQFFRQQKYRPSMLGNHLEAALPSHPDSELERTTLEAELKEHTDFLLIQRHLKNLPIHYQEVISLRYFENKDNHEISIILHKPEGTVKSLLSRGLEKLRKLVLK